MKDFVRVLQTYCENNNIVYHYGKKANLNLLDSDLIDEQVYCLHEPSPRKVEMNGTKTKVKSYLFTGMFFLVKKSDLDMPYLVELGNDEDISKYKLNIEPLLNLSHTMVNKFGCSDIEVIDWTCIDVVDILDVNKDGVLVTYSVRINE